MSDSPTIDRRPSSITEPAAVRAALAEFDVKGRDEFLNTYRFGKSLSYFLVHNGAKYDAKAILGAAFAHQHPAERALSNNEFDGGAETERALTRLGFTVIREATKMNVLDLFERIKFSSTPEGTPYPHKALVVLDALSRFRNAEPRLTLVADLRQRVEGPLRELLPNIDDVSAYEPIWRLESNVWEVVDASGDVLTRSGDPRQSLLSQPGVRCGLPEGLFEELSADPCLVDQIEQVVRRRFAMPADRRWVFVYVGDASKTNLVHTYSRSPECVWGWKKSHDDLASVQPGDLIVFASDLSEGGPRSSAAVFATKSFGSIRLGRITTALYRDNDPYWPDETETPSVYPFRIGFEPEADFTDLSMSEIDATLGVMASGNFRWAATRNAAVVTSPPLAVAQGPLPTAHQQPTRPASGLNAVCAAISESLRAAGLHFGPGDEHDAFVRTVVVSLATKRFVILTGLSGSGKTQIAQQIGRWMGKGQHLLVPVRPDWTSPEAVLGYENALARAADGRPAWSVPRTLEFMLRAAADPTRPYLLILDEMNLAHVERYFADILSGIESSEPILPDLVCGPDGVWSVRREGSGLRPLPENLFIVGTVNVDETTYMFSPKVLDRANTIEFRVSTEALQISGRPSSVEPGDDALIAALLVTANRQATSRADRTEIASQLADLHQLLAGFGREFGHRTHGEALRFADLLAEAGIAGAESALDLIVMQKVLPKFHGSIRDLEEPLVALGGWCASVSADSPSAPERYDPLTFDGEVRFPRSHAKIVRMTTRLRQNHFVGFTE